MLPGHRSKPHLSGLPCDGASKCRGAAGTRLRWSVVFRAVKQRRATVNAGRAARKCFRRALLSVIVGNCSHAPSSGQRGTCSVPGASGRGVAVPCSETASTGALTPLKPPPSLPRDGRAGHACGFALSHNLKVDRNGPWRAVRTFARHGRQSEAHAARASPASCLSWPPTHTGRLELGTTLRVTPGAAPARCGEAA